VKAETGECNSNSTVLQEKGHIHNGIGARQTTRETSLPSTHVFFSKVAILPMSKQSLARVIHVQRYLSCSHISSSVLKWAERQGYEADMNRVPGTKKELRSPSSEEAAPDLAEPER
jgi:hypothetical protein